MLRIGVEDLIRSQLIAERISEGRVVERGDGRSKITGAVLRNGNRDRDVVDLVGFAELFEIEKEESLVAAIVDSRDENRSAERRAVVVAARPRPRIAPLKRGARVQHFVHEVI